MFTTTPVYYILHEKRHYDTYFLPSNYKMETLPHDGIAEALACDPATRRSCHADSDSQPVAILDLGEGGGVEQQRQPEAVAAKGGGGGAVAASDDGLAPVVAAAPRVEVRDWVCR
jgi:hypothetical protein